MGGDNRKVIFDSYWRLEDDGFEDWRQETDYVQDMGEDEQWMEYSEYIWNTLGDERANLDIPLDGTVLAYGCIGRWNGPSYGADPLGSNLNNIFDIEYEEDVSFYVEDDDVYASCPGHDGTSWYCFRLASDDYIEQLEDGEPIGGFEAFKEHTASLAPYVADVYGW